MRRYSLKEKVPAEFSWYNEPETYYFDGGLIIKTKPETDFWQRTHYGFKRDNGHFLYTNINYDFSFTAYLEFNYEGIYDQCGLMLRLDKDNWIKISTEYENEKYSRLGSVVTNLGYSDWATTDIASDIKSMWYRVSKKGQDFLIENSRNGDNWTQMRITHLHQEIKDLEVGIYTCSPQDSSFECKVSNIKITESEWI